MFGDDFYPTPQNLIDKMLDVVKLDTVEAVLEPSAGRGDLVEGISKRISSRFNGRNGAIDTIEFDSDLYAVLESKGYKPVARDFLTFTSFRNYDLIIMNPPFSSGAKHLIRALELQKDGGQIVSLLNAETIRNPYTNERRELVDKLEAPDATIEYVQEAFATAARTTNVETALVYVNIPETKRSDILENLRRAQEFTDEEATPNEVVEGEYITGAVRRYEIEAAAGLKLIREYMALKPLLTTDFEGKNPILELSAGREYGNLRNVFVEKLRMKYWRELFQSSQFAGAFTEKTREAYRNQIDTLKAYEFNIASIKQMQADISASMLDTLDDAIVGLFDEFSSQYWDENSKNIHYYNGWKTNKAWTINQKVITRMNAYGSWDGRYSPSYSNASNKVADIEKVFAYLDGKLQTDTAVLDARLKEAEQSVQTRGVGLEYVTVDFYKKGTAHITFKRADLLKKFNLIGSQRKGWLPPHYGTKDYADMSSEERDVVDSFEGEAAYSDTVKRLDFYHSRVSLAIGTGA